MRALAEAPTPAPDLRDLVRAIELRPNVYTLLDPDDFATDVAWSWNVSWHAKTPWKFYAKRNEGRPRETIYLQRVILLRATGVSWQFARHRHAHHINGQSLDNRRCNLAWLRARENAAIRVKRGGAPTIERIVSDIARDAGAELLTLAELAAASVDQAAAAGERAAAAALAGIAATF